MKTYPLKLAKGPRRNIVAFLQTNRHHKRVIKGSNIKHPVVWKQPSSVHMPTFIISVKRLISESPFEKKLLQRGWKGQAKKKKHSFTWCLWSEIQVQCPLQVHFKPDVHVSTSPMHRQDSAKTGVVITLLMFSFSFLAKLVLPNHKKEGLHVNRTEQNWKMMTDSRCTSAWHAVVELN